MREFITPSEVSQLLFDFAQRCFIGENSSGSIDVSHEKALFERLSQGELNQVDAFGLSPPQKRLLHELLTQYLIYLQQFPSNRFPPEFLSGSSPNCLGKGILDFICEHRWPYPQLLASKKA